MRYLKNSMAELILGKRPRGTTTGRPIMVALDLLGRRMAMRVLWELRSDRLTFRALQAAVGTNPGLLNKRLAELREAQLIDHEPGGYALSEQGQRLFKVMLPLVEWADEWAAETDEPREA
jgi:DNA-binding HxlR family transcriptional regulator